MTARDRILRVAIVAGIALSLVLAFALGLSLAPGSAPTAPSTEQAAAEIWTCAMHPEIRQDQPGACPICGMDLIPVSASPSAGGSDRVVLSERARALIGLRTTEVERRSDPAASVRLLGRVEAAENTRKDVTTWIDGRIDRLHVATTGERVRRGQVVATLYSPDVYAAHQDLLTARAQVASLSDATPAALSAAGVALDAARDRLRLLGVPDAEIAAMEQASTPTRSVRIRSPFSGTITELAATEGAYVKTGQPLYRVNDLRTLWVQLDAYEADLARLSVDQAVTLQIEALPGELFEGRVAFIDPTVDPRRRTAQVRVEVDNTDGRLRPGMFATATVEAALPGAGAPLVIPHSAPLFTGRRSVVYVEHEHDGVRSYEPRTVRLGPRLGEHYPVVSGLQAGERVVTRGAFAVDADLQIRGGPSMMSAADDSSLDGPEPVLLSAQERDALVPVVQHYLELQRALAEDDLAAAIIAAERIIAGTRAVVLPGRAEAPWSELQPILDRTARGVAASQDLEQARGDFEALSAGIEELLARFGNPLEAPIHVAFCPMAMSSAGARWVQQGETVDNAYFGDAMRRCGEIQEVVAPDTYLSPLPSKAVVGGDPHAGHEH